MKKSVLFDEFNQARKPWGRKAYPVIPHCDWSIKSRSKSLRSQTLKFHPGYEAAKRHGDYTAAQEIIDDLLSEEALLEIDKRIKRKKPVIVAPSLSNNDPKNVIPIWLAHNIGHQLGLDVNRNIFQVDKNHRTNRSGFYRIANNTVFRGQVDVGQTYLIVDDVITMGGTIASLRNFIESNGGSVMGISVLADANPQRARARVLGPEIYDLKPDPEVVQLLRKKHGTKLETFMKRNCGHGFNALTKQEAEFISFFDSTSEIQKSILRETNPPKPSGP